MPSIVSWKLTYFRSDSSQTIIHICSFVSLVFPRQSGRGKYKQIQQLRVDSWNVELVEFGIELKDLLKSRDGQVEGRCDRELSEANPQEHAVLIDRGVGELAKQGRVNSPSDGLLQGSKECSGVLDGQIVKASIECCSCLSFGDLVVMCEDVVAINYTNTGCPSNIPSSLVRTHASSSKEEGNPDGVPSQVVSKAAHTCLNTVSPARKLKSRGVLSTKGSKIGLWAAGTAPPPTPRVGKLLIAAASWARTCASAAWSAIILQWCWQR